MSGGQEKERPQEFLQGKIQEGEDQGDDRRPHDGGKPGRVEVLCDFREFHEW